MMYPVFHFNEQKMDYEIVGLFTKHEDAQAMSDASPPATSSAHLIAMPNPWSMSDIEEFFMKKRLGPLEQKV